jgi:hypothetical protein
VTATSTQPGQGASLLATAAATGGTLELQLPLQAVGTGMTATATVDGKTSAFSACTPVAPNAVATLLHRDTTANTPPAASAATPTP